MNGSGAEHSGEVVEVEIDAEGIAWLYFNRPEKRNAMSPQVNREMFAALRALESDERAKVVVLSGRGEAFSAGMDLKEYFRATDEQARWVQNRVRGEGTDWQYRTLINYSKPTIAMVNGWCFGGAFVPLVSCDLAVADEEATFGLSEVNWGVTPGNLVTRALAETIPARDAMYYVMTGEHFDGRKAEQMRLVNEAVPAERLVERTREIARTLMNLNQWVVRGAKMGYRNSRLMPWEIAEDYLYAKHDQAILFEGDARQKGMSAFLDDKTYRPGLGTFDKDTNDSEVTA